MNWQELTYKEYNLIWDKFYKEFNFRPSVEIFPAIQTKLPILKLDIYKIWLDYPDDYYDKFIDLGEKLFLKLSQPEDLIYALDWQHKCFRFNPNIGFKEKGLFTPGLVPDGDYYIFITADFQNMWFGHPWEQKITLAGSEIVRLALDLETEFKNIDIKYIKD